MLFGRLGGLVRETWVCIWETPGQSGRVGIGDIIIGFLSVSSEVGGGLQNREESEIFSLFREGRWRQCVIRDGSDCLM